MKTPRLLALVTAAALLVAVPPHSPAAEVAVDVSSFAPRDPDAVIQQIELNVLVKQYEKLLTQIHDVQLEHELARLESSGTDKQVKEMDERVQGKLMTLERAQHNCRARIHEIVGHAQAKAEAIEKQKREAQKATGQSQPNRGTLTLNGKSGDATSGLRLTANTAGKAPQTGPLTLEGSQGTQTGTNETISAGTLQVEGNPPKATTPPKAPQTGTLTLTGTNTYTSPTKLSPNAKPSP